MSGILLASVGASFGVPVPEIGAAYEGGFFAGQISTAANGIADYNLVVAPKSSGESASKQWKTSSTNTPGASSAIDGPGNTAAMIAQGAALHPAGDFCNSLTIGGFSDWYMPAEDELEVCYYNLKPTTTNNSTGSGTNTYAVPSRPSNYTTGTPAQTSATDFQTGNTEAFDTANNYWSSTQDGTGAFAFWQYFSNGNQFDSSKSTSLWVRAIRRVAV